jgi:hypothetical protein
MATAAIPAPTTTAAEPIPTSPPVALRPDRADPGPFLLLDISYRLLDIAYFNAIQNGA